MVNMSVEEEPARVASLFAVSRGLPQPAAVGLERAGEPGLEPIRVATALQVWRDVCGKPKAVLDGENNDWTMFIGPDARAVLEAALEVLSRSESAGLRRELARLDADFEAKTLHNPRSDPTLPWWARRGWP